jgi:hypothetical protein
LIAKEDIAILLFASRSHESSPDYARRVGFSSCGCKQIGATKADWEAKNLTCDIPITWNTSCAMPGDFLLTDGVAEAGYPKRCR